MLIEKQILRPGENILSVKARVNKGKNIEPKPGMSFE
jgi:hypothetical protein